jgi:hypothetical protein
VRKLSEKLRDIDACELAVTWAEGYDARSYEEALAEVPFASWLCFLLAGLFERDLISHEPIFAAGDAIIKLGIGEYSAAEFEMHKIVWRDKPERYLYRVLEQYFIRHPVRESKTHLDAIRGALGSDLIAAMRALP